MAEHKQTSITEEIDIDKIAEAIKMGDKQYRKAHPVYICPNQLCDHQGPMIRIPNGYMFVFLLLLLCGVVPGIIYVIAHCGYTYICPKCRNKFRHVSRIKL